ncbi:hypothetical protein FACS1894205_0900 [Alphaproteobacteria bacterium]|nr:hypothetical protein FACS1894205_0900 [Alphaproteobacteria bacterium]
MTEPESQGFSLRSAEEEIEKLGSVILTARKRIAAGSIVDLSAMGERIASFCEQARTLPETDRKKATESMGILLRKLQTLENELKDRLDSTFPQMKD